MAAAKYGKIDFDTGQLFSGSTLRQQLSPVTTSNKTLLGRGPLRRVEFWAGSLELNLLLNWTAEFQLLLEFKPFLLHHSSHWTLNFSCTTFCTLHFLNLLFSVFALYYYSIHFKSLQAFQRFMQNQSLEAALTL